MYRIIDNRATGKTSRLMLLAKENDGIIVCKDPKAMRDKAYRYGIVGIDFISYSEFEFTHRFNKPVFIDEIDLLLAQKNREIQGYTISNED
jgi:hypothetical protein